MSEELYLFPLEDFEEDDSFNWQDEWDDMPEYNMHRIKPILTIKMNFRTQEDVERFASLIEQNITPRVRNYWYPKLNIKTISELVYVDES